CPCSAVCGGTGASFRLTRTSRPLYSAGFVTSAKQRSASPCGGIGRRARLKIEFRKECWFDSGQGHHLKIKHLNLLDELPKSPTTLFGGTRFCSRFDVSRFD